MSIPPTETQKPEEGTCANINECLTGDHRCDENAWCTDEVASKDNLYNFYSCHCHVGYDGDGTYCDLIDQCRSGPCPINSDCTSHFTGVHCDCHEGYSASGPQPLESCDDIDECVFNYGASISPCVDLAR